MKKIEAVQEPKWQFFPELIQLAYAVEFAPDPQWQMGAQSVALSLSLRRDIGVPRGQVVNFDRRDAAHAAVEP